MVSDYVRLITFVDHVYVAEVLFWVALMLTIDLDDLVDCVASSIQASSLTRISERVVFLVLAAIHFHKRSSVSTIETWMLSSAEVVKLVDHVINVLPKTVENDCELSLLLLHVH